MTKSIKIAISFKFAIIFEVKFRRNILRSNLILRAQKAAIRLQCESIRCEYRHYLEWFQNIAGNVLQS